MSAGESPLHWYHLTADRFVLGLLAGEVFLLLSEHFQWFPFNAKKGWTVLIGLAVLSLAILVLLAWFGFSRVFRRRYQFGVRTLLLFVLVGAIVCSWFSAKMHQAREQRRAVLAVFAAGGSWEYDYELAFEADGWPMPVGEGPVSARGRKLLGDDFSGDVISVYLRDTGTDATLERIKSLAKLESLDLSHTYVTDAGLEHVQGRTYLKVLVLRGTRVTDAGLEHLQELTGLAVLDLGDTEVTDAGLESLKGLTQLRILSLDGTRVTGHGVKKLDDALPHCVIWSPPTEEFRRLLRRLNRPLPDGETGR